MIEFFIAVYCIIAVLVAFAATIGTIAAPLRPPPFEEQFPRCLAYGIFWLPLIFKFVIAHFLSAVKVGIGMLRK